MYCKGVWPQRARELRVDDLVQLRRGVPEAVVVRLRAALVLPELLHLSPPGGCGCNPVLSDSIFSVFVFFIVFFSAFVFFWCIEVRFGTI